MLTSNGNFGGWMIILPEFTGIADVFASTNYLGDINEQQLQLLTLLAEMLMAANQVICTCSFP